MWLSYLAQALNCQWTRARQSGSAGSPGRTRNDGPESRVQTRSVLIRVKADLGQVHPGIRSSKSPATSRSAFRAVWTRISTRSTRARCRTISVHRPTGSARTCPGQSLVVVRPGNPGGGVRFPLGGHPVTKRWRASISGCVSHRRWEPCGEKRRWNRSHGFGTRIKHG